jgi:hypothetical protein
MRDGIDDLDRGDLLHIHALMKRKKSSKRAADAEYHARLAHEYYAGRRPKEAIRHYIKSLKFSPLRIKNLLLLIRAVINIKTKKR